MDVVAWFGREAARRGGALSHRYSGAEPVVTGDAVYLTGYRAAYKLDSISGAIVWHYVGAGSGGGALAPALFGDRLYMRDRLDSPNLIFDTHTSFETRRLVDSAIPPFRPSATAWPICWT